ncbi:prephenate dehydratase [Paenibacillus cellulosilyticus]|uniref:Prephenate dehydratase n=1 Tax=Paenibacillus cellulosilyticus TaxID=375489 RepID=A0A2V2YJ20_9BACL|nr:prephenate dehydratase [Paenibacillus cellulosilyticus]PWV91974.1 prephenate dehydratase [Paenibacillus cellulosilyticus]QKS46668.1 prephenate dehydratase [Paenibacillus cellulosilyticus]
MKVAVLPKGSTSDDAARYILGEIDGVDFHYHRLIAEVFASTAEGITDYSVIPIENTIDGSVSLHTDMLIDDVDLPIQAEWVYPSIQNLVGRLSELDRKPNGELDYSRIVKVMSHPVAMAQCRQFLKQHIPHAELEHVGSTTEAIRTVRDNPGIGWAAIGQKTAAQHNGLDVLQESVTDHDNNYTRFLLIGPKPLNGKTSDKHKTTIIVSSQEDYPGGLHQVLSALAWRRINLSRIESRPTKKKLGTYYFLIDIDMSLESILLQSAIAEIEAIGFQVRVMGSYPSFSYKPALK